MESLKSPGPDFFNTGWIKKIWNWLKDQMMEFFNNFHASAFIPGRANSSFLVLITKVANPGTINEFPPISLINSQFKILLKVQANIIKPLLDKVISDDQFAFL